jgi:hypothetical protein
LTNTLRMISLAALMPLAIHATEITFSSAASTTNSTTGATTAYTSGQINGTWDATLFAGSSSSWISFNAANLFGCNAAHNQTVNKGTTATFCGPGFTSPNTITFTDTFSLGALSGTYTLWALADDSTSITVNGHSVVAAGSGSSGPCSTTSGAVNCITPMTFNVTADLNASASNTIVFGVTQNLSNSEFGLNFDLVQSTVPEPATFGLVGLALAGLGALRIRSRRSL